MAGHDPRWSSCNVCEARFDPSSTVRWRKDGLDIVECPACGLVFRAELPSRDGLRSIYNVGYFVREEQDTAGQGYLDYLGGDDLHRRTARARLRLLRQFIEPGRLLDVGAAAGFFVDEACQAGWNAQGIDISAEMVEWGASNLGVMLQHGDFADLPIEGEAFDAVTMWDYIEHSPDPTSDLSVVYRVLRPGGIVTLSTGDIGAPFARLSKSRWHLLTPRHHNFFFSAATLRRLLERRGFTIERVEHSGAVYSLAYLAHKLRTLSSHRLLGTLARTLELSAPGRIAVPVNLGDIITVVARRPASS